MNFDFTSEQQLLQDSARRYVSEQYDFDARRRILASADGYSRRVWAELADLGLLAIGIPESDGGLGGTAVDQMIVSIALGEGLVVEPYLSSAVLATRAISTLGSGAQRAKWLPALGSGSLIAVLAHEAVAGIDPAAATTRATPAGAGWRLNGRKAVVYHAPAADLLLVSARVGDAGGAPDALFAVARTAAGVGLDSYVTVDGQVAADVEFRDVALDTEARLGADVTAGLAAVVDWGLAGLCAETLGTLERTLALTVEYCRTRNQFGGPIGRFQVLQHRMVDMLTHIEQARSMVYLAAMQSGSGDAVERERTLSATKVIVGQAARFVGQQAVQLHGGMGVSDEVVVSHCFKRLVAAGIRFGNAEDHAERYARHLTAA